jgi:hypothetical protein
MIDEGRGHSVFVTFRNFHTLSDILILCVESSNNVEGDCKFMQWPSCDNPWTWQMVSSVDVVFTSLGLPVMSILRGPYTTPARMRKQVIAQIRLAYTLHQPLVVTRSIMGSVV